MGTLHDSQRLIHCMILIVKNIVIPLVIVNVLFVIVNVILSFNIVLQYCPSILPLKKMCAIPFVIMNIVLFVIVNVILSFNIVLQYCPSILSSLKKCYATHVENRRVNPPPPYLHAPPQFPLLLSQLHFYSDSVC